MSLIGLWLWKYLSLYSQTGITFIFAPNFVVFWILRIEYNIHTQWRAHDMLMHAQTHTHTCIHCVYCGLRRHVSHIKNIAWKWMGNGKCSTISLFHTQAHTLLNTSSVYWRCTAAEHKQCKTRNHVQKKSSRQLRNSCENVWGVCTDPACVCVCVWME